MRRFRIEKLDELISSLSSPKDETTIDNIIDLREEIEQYIDSLGAFGYKNRELYKYKLYKAYIKAVELINKRK